MTLTKIEFRFPMGVFLSAERDRGNDIIVLVEFNEPMGTGTALRYQSLPFDPNGDMNTLSPIIGDICRAATGQPTVDPNLFGKVMKALSRFKPVESVVTAAALL